MYVITTKQQSLVAYNLHVLRLTFMKNLQKA